MLSDNDLNFLNDVNSLKIDARSHELYNLRRVVGSINLTLNNITNDPAVARSKLMGWEGKKVFVYCSGNSCDSSRDVARYICFAGFDVYIYPAGWANLKNVAETQWTQSE